MEQLDLEDYIKEKKSENKKKPKWVNSTYKPIKAGDLVEYHYNQAVQRKKHVGLVLQVFPANVYDSAGCEILETNGNKMRIETKWVRKIT